MDQENYKALRKRALSYARFRGMQSEELCEDFAQEYCLAIFEGHTRILPFQFANFMRKIGGRFYDGKKQDKHFVNLQYEELDENTVFSLTMAPPVDPIREVQYSELRSSLALLNARELLVASFYLRGFSQKEIAYKMGYDPTRICQIIRDICAKLRHVLNS